MYDTTSTTLIHQGIHPSECKRWRAKLSMLILTYAHGPAIRARGRFIGVVGVSTEFSFRRVFAFPPPSQARHLALACRSKHLPRKASSHSIRVSRRLEYQNFRSCLSNGLCFPPLSSQSPKTPSSQPLHSSSSEERSNRRTRLHVHLGSRRAFRASEQPPYLYSCLYPWQDMHPSPWYQIVAARLARHWVVPHCLPQLQVHAPAVAGRECWATTSLA